jgi:hypothetical protein
LVVQTADGGALVVWNEKRGGEYDVRARKLDENGAPEGPSTAICDAPGHQMLSGFIDDGAGGGIVGWTDFAAADPRFYAQRIDGDAVPLWAANGLLFCDAGGGREGLQFVTDGAGGAIFTWSDRRDAFSPDIYAQRVSAAGSAMWATNGKVVCNLSPQLPGIASDGAGGAIIAWGEGRFIGPVLYAQRVDASGADQWATNGVIIGDYTLTTFSPPFVLGAVPAPGNSAVIMLKEMAFDPPTYELRHVLYVQKVNDAGAAQWGTSGRTVCNALARVEFERIVDDGSGGVYVAWSDHRGSPADVYAQHVDAAGNISWNGNGNVVCGSPSWQTLGGMTRSGGDIFLTWGDRRSGLTDVYAQRVNSSGAGVWTGNGVVVSDATRGQAFPAIAPWESATPERLYVAWTDNRTGSREAQIQRLDLSGVSQWTTDGVTSTQVALASVAASARGVRLVWYASDDVVATVYRRQGDAPWVALGSAFTDGSRKIAFEDTNVDPGARYGYRLGIREGSGDVFVGEVWVDVPDELQLALGGLSPNPASSVLMVSFTLPSGAAARLELLDLAGRRVRDRDLIGYGPGRHVLRLDGPPPAAGVYVIRLTQAGRSVTAKAAVMR